MDEILWKPECLRIWDWFVEVNGKLLSPWILGEEKERCTSPEALLVLGTKKGVLSNSQETWSKSKSWSERLQIL